MDSEGRGGSGQKQASSAQSRRSGSTLSSHPGTPLSIHGVGAVKGLYWILCWLLFSMLQNEYSHRHLIAID